MENLNEKGNWEVTEPVSAVDVISNIQEQVDAATQDMDVSLVRSGMERLYEGMEDVPRNPNDCKVMIIEELEYRLSIVDATILEDEEKQKGLYGKILAVCEDTDACAYQNYPLNTLKSRVADCVWDMLTDEVIPEILKELEKGTEEEAGAYSYSGQGGIDVDEILTILELALISVAVAGLIMSFMMPAAGIVATSLSSLLAEGSAAGVGVAIAEEIAFLKPYVAVALKITAGSGLLAGLCHWIRNLFNPDPPNNPVNDFNYVSLNDCC